MLLLQFLHVYQSSEHSKRRVSLSSSARNGEKEAFNYLSTALLYIELVAFMISYCCTQHFVLYVFFVFCSHTSSLFVSVSKHLSCRQHPIFLLVAPLEIQKYLHLHVRNVQCNFYIFLVKDLKSDNGY